MITIGPSRTMNGICPLKSLPLNPPLSSTTRNALRMEMVRTASTRPTFGSPLFQVILRNSKPQRQHTIQKALEEQRTRDTHKPTAPHRPYSTSPVRQTRSSKARRGLKEKTRKTKPTIMIFLPVFFSDSDTAVTATPPPNHRNTRLKRSQLQKTMVHVRGLKRERLMP